MDPEITTPTLNPHFDTWLQKIGANLTTVQKADLSLGDLTTAGVLKPAQAQTFLRILIDQSKFLPLTSFIPMASPSQEIDKIRFASRILRPGEEAKALPLGDRAKPETTKVTIDAKLYKGEVRLSNEVLEDSIERGQLRQTIMQLIAERCGLDTEEAVIKGDTASADAFLAVQDGVLKQATTNVVDALTVFANKGIWRDMLKTMPTEFLRNKAMLRIITSNDAEIDYRDSVAERATSLGDTSLTTDGMAQYNSIPILGVPLFPENLGGGTNTTNALLLDPKNVFIGFWRDIRLETDKDVSAGTVIIVATLRFGVKFAHEPAVVKAINIKVKN